MEKLWPSKGRRSISSCRSGPGFSSLRRPTCRADEPGLLRRHARHVQRQLDSKSSWTGFERSSPADVRCRLRRVDPPLPGDFVELYDSKRIPEIVQAVRRWTRGEAASHIREVAATLIANLFFFEPDDGDSVGTWQPLSDPSCDVLAGSIRCRLEHGSPHLQQLLRTIVEGFHYAQTVSDTTEERCMTGSGSRSARSRSQ